MRECDAVAVFTTKGLLQKVAAAIKDCSTFKQVVYFAELHQHPDEPITASEKVQELFTKTGCSIHSFDSLINVGANNGKFFAFCRVFQWSCRGQGVFDLFKFFAEQLI